MQSQFFVGNPDTTNAFPYQQPGFPVKNKIVCKKLQWQIYPIKGKTSKTTASYFFRSFCLLSCIYVFFYYFCLHGHWPTRNFSLKNLFFRQGRKIPICVHIILKELYHALLSVLLNQHQQYHVPLSN